MYEVIQGDCLAVLPTLVEAGSVHCCITSPPYFGLRDYGHAEQIGLEATPDAYVVRMVEVFRAVRRVLRGDGTLWLNLGDSYGAAGGSTKKGFNERYFGRPASVADKQGDDRGHVANRPPSDLPAKSLLGIPWRVAFALQADGWTLRQDIVWAKGNPMPESVTDRCTKAHEYVFLLSKSPRYYFDADAIREDGSGQVQGGLRHKHIEGGDGVKNRTKLGLMDLVGTKWETRNKRSVWTVNPQPFPGAHFAVMPEALVLPCLLAGCPEGGTVLDPFAGSGTVGVVAAKHWRNFVGVELNPAYCAMARDRIARAAGEGTLFPAGGVVPRVPDLPGQTTLFAEGAADAE